MNVLKRITPKPNEPSKRGYVVALLITWLYIGLWALCTYLVYFVWKPSLVWEIVIGIILIGGVPDFSDFFYTYDKYSTEILSRRSSGDAKEIE